jgi:hypothetical protein
MSGARHTLVSPSGRRSLGVTVAAVAAVSLGVAWYSPSARADGPGQVGHAAACAVYDASSKTGVRVGSNPFRWEYANSPYIGARFDQCADVIYIYYGGYTGITHYNIRLADQGFNRVYLIRQFEVGSGSARRYTLSANTVSAAWLLITVQACRRGTGPFSSSDCTRWSPTIDFGRKISSA